MPSAAILVGGQARRFGGRDKGALRVAGRSIREWQMAALRSVSDDIWLIGGTPPDGATADAAHAPDADPAIRWAADDHPGLGPLAGIETALRVARDDLVLVVAGDMPGVTPALFSHLLARANDPPPERPVDIVVPRTETGYHPLCAVYRASTCRAAVAAQLAGGVLAVRMLFGRLRVREVTGSDLAALGDPQAMLANVNTPAEHDTLAARLAHET